MNRSPDLTKLSSCWYSIALLFLFAAAAFSQTGKIVRETIHAKSLENTVTKENPKRNISVYLPPSYQSSADRRYPVIYLLHGIGDTDQTWTSGWDKNNRGYATIQDVMNRGIAEGRFGEIIIAMPDQKTNWFGSYYVNSSVTGNWEDFTVRELVNHIDTKYRTIAKAENRGIGGHSMGGYGAITLGMKHPGVFSVVYGLNPALMAWGGDFTIQNPAFQFVLNAKSLQEVAQTGDIYRIGLITVGQAFSPNPDKPPFYFDPPFKMAGGKLVPDKKAFAKWNEKNPGQPARKVPLKPDKTARSSVLIRGTTTDSDSYR